MATIRREVSQYPGFLGGEYSPTVAGYGGWLGDGYTGEFYDFLEFCARAGDRLEVMDKVLNILDELEGDYLEDAKKFLGRKNRRKEV